MKLGKNAKISETDPPLTTVGGGSFFIGGIGNNIPYGCSFETLYYPSK